MADEDDKESLEQQNTDVRFPQLERVRSPKRTNADELSDDDTREHKRQTVALISELPKFTIGAISATTVDGDVPVCRKQDTEEIIEELKLVEPQLDYVENEFPEEEVIDGMQIEMKSMKSFDVYDEIPIEKCSQEDIDNAWDGTWVKRRKTAAKVRCRLCVRGCFPETMDQDDVLASAPTLVTLRVLLLMTLSRCWTATTFDISAAFLHAPMTERILMKPPSEYYPTGNCLWLLKRAMYGLKQAPALWQTHFAKVMTELVIHRCKTYSNLYSHKSTEHYVLCYVDDLLVCGTPQRTKEFTNRLSQEVLLKVEGELKPQTSAEH